MVVNCEHLLKFVAEAKEEGNAAFKARKYSDALTAWQAGLDAIAQADGRPMLVEDMRLVVVVRSVLHSNRGQALMKMEFWRRAIKDLDEAIRIDGENVKALWRRSKAHEALKEWGQAEADVEALLSPRLQEVAGPLLVDAGLDAPKLEEARARLRGCRDEAERVAEETFEERAEDAAHRGITELRERFEQAPLLAPSPSRGPRRRLPSVGDTAERAAWQHGAGRGAGRYGHAPRRGDGGLRGGRLPD